MSQDNVDTAFKILRDEVEQISNSLYREMAEAQNNLDIDRFDRLVKKSAQINTYRSQIQELQRGWSDLTAFPNILKLRLAPSSQHTRETWKVIHIVQRDIVSGKPRGFSPPWTKYLGFSIPLRAMKH